MPALARVILGVGAGIAAYRACELLRLLTESGYRVRVVPTPDALRFVGEPTWAALSGEPVTTDVWTGVAEVPHVRLGQSADLVLVVPATADLLARAAAGMAGDLLTATLLTARCPVLYAPAMHTEMWEHPATQANVSLLRSRGAVVLEPAVGRLTGADSGAWPPARAAGDLRGGGQPARHRRPAGAATWPGRCVVVSAGGTREEIDPVRFIGNWSSGTQGYALARTAVARGAEVTVIAANVTLPDPAGAKVTRVVSALQMRERGPVRRGRRRRGRDGGRGGRLPARDSERGQDQEGRAATRAAAPGREPGHPGWAGRAAGSRRRAPGPGRVRGRDGHLGAGGPGQARPQGV